jgi:hypothetical protein
VGALGPDAAAAAADLTNLDLEALVESAAEPDRPANGERLVVLPDDLTVVMPLGGDDLADDPDDEDADEPPAVAAAPRDPAALGDPTAAGTRRWTRPLGALAVLVVLAGAAIGGWLLFHTPSAPVP